jgi:hypothetical protein
MLAAVAIKVIEDLIKFPIITSKFKMALASGLLNIIGISGLPLNLNWKSLLNRKRSK